MRRIKLDKIDRRILRDLQANGRMTNVELARRAGISAPPCLRRVRALESVMCGAVVFGEGGLFVSGCNLPTQCGSFKE